MLHLKEQCVGWEMLQLKNVCFNYVILRGKTSKYTEQIRNRAQVSQNHKLFFV